MIHNGTLQAWLDSSPLAGDNQSCSYVEALYATYLTDANQVDADWRALFDGLHNTELFEAPRRSAAAESSVQPWQVLALINAFRADGHRQAQLDPLNLCQQVPLPQLQLAFHHFTLADLTTRVDVSMLAIGQSTMLLGDLHHWLQKTYCGPIGAEYMHLSNVKQRDWLQQRLESASSESFVSPERQHWLLRQLTAADGLERYLAVKFPGAKRFSLEGGDSLIPLLNQLITQAGQQGAAEIILGMAHRGRLNVLVNVLGKKPSDLVAAFSGKQHALPGSGDVKYHQGFSASVTTASAPVTVSLLPNPSHLEIVSPVVMGVARARQDQCNDEQGEQILAITLHGDSAMAGQGVVQETFNLSQVAGYRVGGTIRIVINNQIGFTTTNQDARSSYYCTDIAKMIEAPVLHVNGDDPQAVMLVAQLAFDFRHTFKRDVVIDLVCYRRHGHNEADEPSATQPLMYQCIKQHPTPRTVYLKQLMAAQLIGTQQADALVTDYRTALELGEAVVAATPVTADLQLQPVFVGADSDAAVAIPAIACSQLQALGRKMCHYPDGFPLHNRVEKIYQDRLKMVAGQQGVDWGAAEMLAYATLLAQGIDIRLSGQDSGRGTFFHRHAVLHHQQAQRRYVPLSNLQPQQGRFCIWDSVLSEASVLAFEYGYALAAPRSLVIWEAQFGDFANGAQVVIDQFISASEQKWGQCSAVTLLLPHGYEGQGPEHSSARLERYLQLCAEQNLQVCVPSNAAQIYHLLRRQALQPMRRPLVILSPKSLLRHSLASAVLTDLAEGGFQSVLGEVDALSNSEVVRIVLCSGKIYYDLLEQRRKNDQNNGQKNVALLRIEQLYPFPSKCLQVLLAHYPQARSIVWCQEEPMNQGAWLFVQAYLSDLITSSASSAAAHAVTLHPVTRPAAASTAVGYLSQHQQQQQALVDQALDIAGDTSMKQPILLQGNRGR